MKKILYFIVAVALLGSCAEKEESAQPGSIYGVVSDQLTKETLQEVTVSLSEKQQHTTGSDGRYEFKDLSEGSYTLKISKHGYKSKEEKVSITAGKDTPFNFSIEKLQPILTVTDGNRNPIPSLNFGENSSADFNIYNDGDATLVWSLSWDCSWIKQVSVSKGELQPNKVAGVIVTIDRDKLSGGTNTGKLHITATGVTTKELTMTATGEVKIRPKLNTLTTTEITTTTATLNGEILENGTPAYTERGFVYALSSMPTLESTITKITAPLTSDTTYSANVTGLTLGETYYVRAYAINSVDTAYSNNEDVFKTEMTLPTVTTQAISNKNIAAGMATFNGTIVSEGDPVYTERGFVYGVQHNPTVGNGTKVESGGNGIGLFSQPIIELAEGTYYVRAYAKNAKDYAYGKEEILDFNAVKPKFSTDQVTETDGTSVTFNGNISDRGDPPYIERGFIYSTLPTPIMENSIKVPVDGKDGGKYHYKVDGLILGETYYVTTYVITDKEKPPYYGNIITFSISPYTVVGTIWVQKEDVGIGNYTEAGSACKDLRIGGYDDWQLPSKSTLETLYDVHNVINLDKNGYYWSSTPLTYRYPCCPTCPGSSTRMCTSILGYYCLEMATGTTSAIGTGKTGNIRCVRTLP